MQTEKIKEFTRKITISNRSGLIVIMYDMLDTYLADAGQALKENRDRDFKENIRNADAVLRELQDVLDFKYEISGNLYSLYVYCREELAKTLMKHNTEGISNAEKVLQPLRASFKKVAETDVSEPLMKNTQQVYAGMTYGKNDLTENYDDREATRGFFA